jgi:signal transduction histidine kinase
MPARGPPDTLSAMDDDRAVLTRQLSRSQLILLDGAVAAAYALVLVAIVISRPPTGDPGGAASTWLQLVVVLTMAVPLAARRVWPVPVFGVVFAASVLALVLANTRDGFLGAAFALYVVATRERRPAREPTLLIAALSVAGIVLLVAGGSTAPIDASVGSIVLGALVLGCAWTIGRAVRERRLFAARAAAQLVERSVAGERLRIARDLHDVIAHGLSLIVVKAGTANHVAGTRPEEAREALQVIETTGRAALVEMRDMLRVLRAEDPGAEPDELAPAPTLDDLPVLAERVAMAGVRVDFELVGLGDLPEGVGRSIFRIVQEALTNVVKHAAPARCHVAITAADGEARVEIVDDGLRAALEGDEVDREPGHGLIGLRERVRLLGGELSAGPRPSRGFRVLARIPYGAPADATARRP